MLACTLFTGPTRPASTWRFTDVEDEDETKTTGLPPELERLLAGTLALMTTWYACPHPEICRKLIDNLSLIGEHRLVSAPLKRVCANAAARWGSYLEEAEYAIAADVEQNGADDDDERDPELPGNTALRGPATLH